MVQGEVKPMRSGCMWFRGQVLWGAVGGWWQEEEEEAVVVVVGRRVA